MQEDHALLDSWRNGDNEAGEQLAERYLPALRRFFRNKAPEACEDLVQQCFLACVEARSNVEQSFRAYLYSVARFQLYSHFRRKRARGQLDFTSTSVQDLATSPSARVSRDEQHQLLREAFQHIPLDHQIALELTYFEGLSAKEIAAVLEVPENTVYSRTARAKQQLREAMARLGALP